MSDRETIDHGFGSPLFDDRPSLPIARQLPECPECGYVFGRPTFSCPECGLPINDRTPTPTRRSDHGTD